MEGEGERAKGEEQESLIRRDKHLTYKTKYITTVLSRRLK